ncbi:MAG: hypothetical protein ONB44_06375 [candidate division KSB1 bacterium]|nr:hypothetical protein [candidate division KSB1 bacterium]MDZ7301749.1 hypothetical protein [candidate division KSB1 bacterium]MDZ7311472.1 hypothetical protein [candidate division KSB1 bacterium]
MEKIFWDCSSVIHLAQKDVKTAQSTEAISLTPRLIAVLLKYNSSGQP